MKPLTGVPAAAPERRLAGGAARHPTIALLQTSSLASASQAELERMILSGELGPGAKLTEMALRAPGTAPPPARPGCCRGRWPSCARPATTRPPP